MGWTKGSRVASLSLLLLLSLSACRGRKKSEAEPKPPAPAACAANADCPEHWVCLASRCTDPGSTAIYSDPSNAVTPEKVEREVEQVGEKHQRDIDQAVEGAQ